MGSMYGFQNPHQQRPSPQPAEVGQMLVQRAMGGEEGEQPPPEAMGEPDPHGMAQGSPWPSAAEAALRAAILRAPGNVKGSNPRPPAAGNRAQLERLGLSPEEIELLNSTGGANV